MYAKEQRKEITWLNISQKNLHGALDLTDFVNLESLDCSENNLTSLNLNNCSGLIKIICTNNQLTNLTLPKDTSNLKKLNL